MLKKLKMSNVNLKKYHKKETIVLIVLILIILITFFLSLFIGQYHIPFWKIIKILFSISFGGIERDWPIVEENIIVNIRLPRIILALFVGAGLSCVGATYQNIFQNPIVSPDIIGATSGACLGASFALFFEMSMFYVSLISFLSGLAVVFVVCFVNFLLKSKHLLYYVLIGILISSMCNGLISYIKLIADQNNTLPSITYWLMGSFSNATLQVDLFVGIITFVCVLLIFLFRWELNILTLGDTQAKSLGVSVGALRILMIICATFITASAISTTGQIGWIGLLMPHLSSFVVGNDFRYKMPACMLLGGTFMLIIDDLARTISITEVPIGILLSIIGAPLFLFFLIKNRRLYNNL